MTLSKKFSILGLLAIIASVFIPLQTAHADEDWATPVVNWQQVSSSNGVQQEDGSTTRNGRVLGVLLYQAIKPSNVGSIDELTLTLDTSGAGEHWTGNFDDTLVFLGDANVTDKFTIVNNNGVATAQASSDFLTTLNAIDAETNIRMYISGRINMSGFEFNSETPVKVTGSVSVNNAPIGIKEQIVTVRVGALDDPTKVWVEGVDEAIEIAKTKNPEWGVGNTDVPLSLIQALDTKATTKRVGDGTVVVVTQSFDGNTALNVSSLAFVDDVSKSQDYLTWDIEGIKIYDIVPSGDSPDSALTTDVTEFFTITFENGVIRVEAKNEFFQQLHSFISRKVGRSTLHLIVPAVVTNNTNGAGEVTEIVNQAEVIINGAVAKSGEVSILIDKSDMEVPKETPTPEPTPETERPVVQQAKAPLAETGAGGLLSAFLFASGLIVLGLGLRRNSA